MLFEEFAFIDIAADAHPFAYGAVLLEYRDAAREEVAVDTIVAAQAIFGLVELFCFYCLLPRPIDGLAIIGVNGLQDLLPIHVRRVLAGIRAPRGHFAADAAVAVRGPHNLCDCRD